MLRYSKQPLALLWSNN